LLGPPSGPALTRPETEFDTVHRLPSQGRVRCHLNRKRRATSGEGAPSAAAGGDRVMVQRSINRDSRTMDARPWPRSLRPASIHVRGRGSTVRARCPVRRAPRTVPEGARSSSGGLLRWPDCGPRRAPGFLNGRARWCCALDHVVAAMSDSEADDGLPAQTATAKVVQYLRCAG
jgi:hypothetical protein